MLAGVMNNSIDQVCSGSLRLKAVTEMQNATWQQLVPVDRAVNV